MSLEGLVGACSTSVFFTLMVNPKLSQASEKLLTLCCMSSSEPALRVQSSANRKSLNDVTLVLVLDSSHLGLNSLPSVLYFNCIPLLSTSLKVSDSVTENIILNNVGAKTQPSFTPFDTSSISDISPL